MRARSKTFFVVLLVFLVGARAEAQATLDAAKQLYAAADYENALTMLDSLRTTPRGIDELRSIDLYRVLCLLATGKEDDAQSGIDAFVVRNPLYRPTDDLPPRVRSAFIEARQRLIPTAVQVAYQEAKAAYDFKDFHTAETGFANVLALFGDAEIAAIVGQTSLADLRTLASGFLELSKKQNEPPPAPPPVAKTPPAPAPPRIYGPDDGDVVPPTIVVQQIPPFPGQIRSPQSGVIEVIIDRDGSVLSATMLNSVSPQYDRLALSAAQSWLYHPAMLNGTAVKYVKRIQINLLPAND